MKNSAYGVQTVKLAPPVPGGFPASFDGDNCFSFKAIVMDSLQLNDAAPNQTDINVEETEDVYTTVNSDNGTKGFTMQTYDLSKEAFTYLMGYTHDNATGWNTEPVKKNVLRKAVEIVTRDIDDIPSMTFQWANMDIIVTKAGNIAKSGLPNLSLTFKQLANIDASGKPQPGARNAVTSEIKKG